MTVTSLGHASLANERSLDATLRGYLATNADIVTRIAKPVRMDDIGALSAQSEHADPVREHRREAGLPPVRHAGEAPPRRRRARSASRRRTICARWRYRLRQPPRGFKDVKTGPVKEVIRTGKRRRLDRAADPAPQGQRTQRRTSPR